MFHVPEKFRVANGAYGSTREEGNNGCFLVHAKTKHRPEKLVTIASDQMGWEHVSVSLKNRCPTWAEMMYIKRVFWDPLDLVLQMHVPESDYVNCHPFCLHLWRKAGTNDFCERPPSILVGPRGKYE